MFSIAVLFFAMVAFSSIVGGVTASMTQLQNLLLGSFESCKELVFH